MASVKILLYKSKKNSEGKHPIALRITKDRIPKYKFLEYIDPKDWNEKKGEVKQSHHSYKRINSLIDNEYIRAKNLIFDYESKDKSFTSGHIMSIIKGNKDNITFFRLADDYFEQQEKAGSKWLHTKKSRVKKFKDFLKGEDIHFENITIPLLKRYIVHLKATGSKSKMTIASCLSVIRTIFNVAITDGIVDAQYYPFGKRKLRIDPGKSMKIGLNKDEIKRIENLELDKGSFIWHTKNVFLFSFYLAGIRIGDTVSMRWENITSGRIHYRMGKNQKVDSLQLPPKAMDILKLYKEYKEENNGFIFPEMKDTDLNDLDAVEKIVSNAGKYFNRELKKIAKLAKIDKKITNHISRHSFGNIAGSNIPVQMLQKLYRHSDLSTTINYQSNFDHTQTDEALKNVLDF
ncbi:site-specific integrase [Aquimarina algicola]|uniref:Recombinase n=1 Tax=Aquimarina algicola TaxID=2589995 RepID=A0A504JIF2_9FLAO|nr:site-specific integrase [Aquimarina algicola]TPN87393.1 recombinase [Aquimarina algicola]